EVRRRQNLIVVVSTLEPRKNARFLADWFLNTSALPADMELCWVGPQGWLTHMARPGQHTVGRRRIRFVGSVSDAVLCRLYQEAPSTLSPSLSHRVGP